MQINDDHDVVNRTQNAVPPPEGDEEKKNEDVEGKDEEAQIDDDNDDDIDTASSHVTANLRGIGKYRQLQLTNELSKVDHTYTRTERDEMKLLKMAIQYNWSQEEYNDIVRWSQNLAQGQGLRKYKAMIRDVTIGSADITLEATVEVPVNTTLDGSGSSSDEESSDTIKKTFLFNDIIASGLELFDRKKPALKRFQQSEIISELNHGDWWKETEEQFCTDENGDLVPDKYLLPMIVFIDGVLADNRGKLTILPLLLTLGLFKCAELKQDGCREYIASLPKVKKSKNEGTKICDAELDLFHRALDEVLNPIRECAANGGFLYEVEETIVTFVPCVPFLVQDTKEGNRICTHFDSWQAEQPCRICTVRFGDCDNPDATAPLRNQAEERGIVESCRKIIEDREHGTVTAARNRLK